MKNNFKIFNSKEEAQRELVKLIKVAIIEDVRITDDWKFYIGWVNEKQHYANSLEAQASMEKYEAYLLSLLEPEETKVEIKSDVQIEQESRNQLEPFNEKEVWKQEATDWVANMFKEQK